MIKITKQAKKQGYKDYLEFKDLIKGKSFEDVYNLNNVSFDPFNLDDELFDFNFKSISGTLLKYNIPVILDNIDIWYKDNAFTYEINELKSL